MPTQPASSPRSASYRSPSGRASIHSDLDAEIGIAVLAAASLVAGLSGTLAVLIAGRAGQGFGAALAAPNALAILSDVLAVLAALVLARVPAEAPPPGRARSDIGARAR